MKVSIAFDRLRWEEKALKDAAESLGMSASLVDVKGLVFQVPRRLTEMGDVVAQREQEVVFAVVLCAKEDAGFGDELLVMVNQLRAHLECRGAIGGQIDFVRRA